MRVVGPTRGVALALVATGCLFALSLNACAAARRPTPAELAQADSCRNQANVERLQTLFVLRTQAQNTDADYKVSPGDLLAVTIYNYRLEGGDFVSEVRVDDRGFISLPIIDPISVTGKSVADVRRALVSAIEKAEVLREPMVAVFLKDYKGQQAVVLGAVQKPGMYSLTKGHQSLIDVISLAGGLTEHAGNFVLIGEGARMGLGTLSDPPQPGSEPGAVADDPPPAIDTPLSSNPNMVSLCFDTASGEPNPLALTLPVRAGDVIMVPEAGQAYIEGEVAKPGPYPLTRGMTLTQLVSTAGGLIFPAKPSRVKMVRTAIPGQTLEWEVDLDSINKQQQPDLRLERSDRVVVPYRMGRKVAYGFYLVVKGLVNFTVGGVATVF
jgi:polysaccharide biosynthesis/export protein